MKTFSKKIMVSLLAVITALCAFFGVLLISPQTVSADETVATASTVDYSTWKKTQLNVGDTIYNKTIMMRLDITETHPGYFFSTTSQGTCDTVKIFDARVWTALLTEGEGYISLIEYLRSENQDYLNVQMQATDSAFFWESKQINLDEAWFVFSFDEQSYTFQGAYEMCECETVHENADVWVDANDTITAIAEGVTLYELTKPILANYDLTSVQTLDHDKYTQENAITEETNFANAWIRLYNGMTQNVNLGGIDEGWLLNNLSYNHRLCYISSDHVDIYYIKLPTIVSENYIDVYIPSGTFTSEDGYEVTIPEELYVDNLNYVEYDTHVKLLTVDAQADPNPLPDDENKPGIDLDGVGDWVNDKGDKISDWLKTEWGVAISGTSVIVIIVGAIVLISIFGKKKR